MSSAKKQRVELSLAKRYEIASKLKNSEKQQSIAEHYNVDRSTVEKQRKIRCQWKKNLNLGNECFNQTQKINSI